jgi:hypothetical protein
MDMLFGIARMAQLEVNGRKNLPDATADRLKYSRIRDAHENNAARTKE